jgi:putative transposase
MERFNRLAHSIWDCKYHVVWIPKYRRKELYGKKRQIVVDTIKQWARIKGIEIIEGHAMPFAFRSRPNMLWHMSSAF